ncbi:MAG: hypothetical protein HXX17_03845 [Geobacteraceae bacterium]|nr:hypothetical protein [Geobacteraceae bacterium]
MKLFNRPAAIIVIAGALVLLVLSLSGISDKEAVDVAKRFYQKTGVRVTAEPRVDSHWLVELMTGEKEVVVGEREKRFSLLTLSTKTKEVASFTLLQWKKSEAEKQIKLELSESEAKETIIGLASRIGLPRDFELDTIKLDKKDGLWGGIWKRKYHGYPFEKDLISIGIREGDGEFFSYWKSSSGRSCPTDVVVTREQALEIARNKVYSLLADERAHLQDYVVSSPELKIVQPNAVFGRFSPYHRANSRLAWAVMYTVNNNKQDLTIGNANFKEWFVIKIDASTGMVIGGSSAR